MQKKFEHPYGVVFEQCKAALVHIGGDVKHFDRSQGFIHGSMGASLLSWGEEVKIVVKSHGNNITEVTINSAAKAQFFTWGKNNSNKVRFLDALSEKLD